jgi:hypothetical protein
MPEFATRQEYVAAAKARFSLAEALVAEHEVPEDTNDQRLLLRDAHIVVGEATLPELWDVLVDPTAPPIARYQIIRYLIELGDLSGDDEIGETALMDLAPQLDELKTHVLGS